MNNISSLIKNRATPLFLVAVFLIAATSQVSAVIAQTDKPIVVCTTQVAGAVVKEMAGEQVDVVILCNPNICPAFYDVTPSDVYGLSNAKLVFYHGFEYDMWLKGMIETSETEAEIVKIPDVWNTPVKAKETITAVAESLTDILGIDVSKKADAMLGEVDTVADEIQNIAENTNVAGKPVVCMAWLTGFATELGLDIVASYGMPQTLSASNITAIVITAKEKNAILVIDNLQSGISVGVKIATDIGASHVVLSNFPGAVPGTDSLAELIKYNTNQILDGVDEYQNLMELKSEITNLQTNMLIYQVIAIVLAIVIVVETAIIAARRRK
jgi:ABC-type Zn uptake system ZnuABC Zn-binding protein ZnuA